MRLFIAINFNDEIKNSLCTTIQRLKQYAKQGNFTRRENLHLTLTFIGETEKVDAVRRAMDKVTSETFNLSMCGIGKFRRDGGDIYWIGVKKDSALSTIHNQLCGELAKVGFTIENREFKPHLTLGREVILDDNFKNDEFSKVIPGIGMKVEKISLMKSERINGKLIYTEIYTKELVEQ